MALRLAEWLPGFLVSCVAIMLPVRVRKTAEGRVRHTARVWRIGKVRNAATGGRTPRRSF